MDYKEYKELIQRYPKPNQRLTDFFVRKVSYDHSWYKHLSSERKEPFIFYLDPNASRKLKKVEESGGFTYYEFMPVEPKKNINTGWQYYTTNYTANFIPDADGSIRDSRPFIGLNIINDYGIAEPLPIEVIEMGTFMMSRYLHRGYEDKTERFDKNNPSVSFSQKHMEIISEIKIQLNLILDNIYND